MCHSCNYVVSVISRFQVLCLCCCSVQSSITCAIPDLKSVRMAPAQMYCFDQQQKTNLCEVSLFAFMLVLYCPDSNCHGYGFMTQWQFADYCFLHGLVCWFTQNFVLFVENILLPPRLTAVPLLLICPEDEVCSRFEVFSKCAPNVYHRNRGEILVHFYDSACRMSDLLYGVYHCSLSPHFLQCGITKQSLCFEYLLLLDITVEHIWSHINLLLDIHVMLLTSFCFVRTFNDNAFCPVADRFACTCHCVVPMCFLIVSQIHFHSIITKSFER